MASIFQALMVSLPQNICWFGNVFVPDQLTGDKYFTHNAHLPNVNSGPFFSNKESGFTFTLLSFPESQIVVRHKSTNISRSWLTVFAPMAYAALEKAPHISVVP